MTPHAHFTFLDFAARRRGRPRLTAIGAAAFLLALGASGAWAQGTARVLDLDPSVRAAGAGGASNAVFWGGDPNYWANPALLGYHRGLRFEWGRSSPPQGFGGQFEFETQRFSANLGGLGVAVAGTPEGFGSVRLGGVDGIPSGTFREQWVESWAVGLSLAELARTASRSTGEPVPELLRHLDVAGGVQRKRVHMHYGSPPFETAETEATDWGVLLRLTPVNTYESVPGRRSRIGGRAPTRFDLAYGFSVLNADDGSLAFFDGPLRPLSRIVRHGVSARVASGRGWRVEDAPWIESAFTPLLAVGFAADHAHVQAGDFPDPSFDVQHYGAEVTVLNCLSLRAGYVNDETHGIHDTTLGAGLGFDLGGMAGVRFDWAQVPRGPRVVRTERRGFTVYVDPLAVIRSAGKGSRIAAAAGDPSPAMAYTP